MEGDEEVHTVGQQAPAYRKARPRAGKPGLERPLRNAALSACKLPWDALGDERRNIASVQGGQHRPCVEDLPAPRADGDT
jgi:hypothetical protein